MVRLKIHGIMKARGISAYALSKGTNLSYPSAWRLSRRGGAFGRLRLFRPPAGLPPQVGAVAGPQQVRWPAFDLEARPQV